QALMGVEPTLQILLRDSLHDTPLRRGQRPTTDVVVTPVSSRSNSLRLGYEGCEPNRVTAKALAATAYLTASSAASRSNRPTARPPVNASPAPVVSTAVRGAART